MKSRLSSLKILASVAAVGSAAAIAGLGTFGTFIEWRGGVRNACLNAGSEAALLGPDRL